MPITEIGSTYEVDPAFPAWTTTPRTLRMGAAITTGGGAVSHHGNVTDAVLAEDTTATGARVEVVGRCLDTVGDVATKDLLGSIAGVGGIASLTTKPDTSAPAGTALVWLDGTSAGELTDDTEFKKLTGVRDRVCLELTLAESTLQACMAADATATIKR